MAIRIGINGFGRMGRLALRAGWGRPDLEFVHVNEVAGGPATAAHLLAFDSVHGKWPHRIESSDQGLSIEGRSISFSANQTPAEIPWSAAKVDVVLECSGKFRTIEKLDAHFQPGVKTVIVAAPVKAGALNVVMGVNDHLYNPQQHRVLTAASCTTNCLAPVVKVIHEALGIKHGVITTIHDITNTQVAKDDTVKAYMTEALKTWRKRNAALILATQSSDDFVDADLLRTVVESCPTKVFLANPGMDLERARDLFHLNHAEAERIAQLLPRQQMLIKRPDFAKVVNLNVDPQSYWIYTNTPVDNVRLEALRRDHDLRAAVDALASHP